MGTHNLFFSRNMKNIRFFYLKIFSFSVVKFSVYLNRHVFVMGPFLTFSCCNLTFTNHWADSADNKLMKFSLFFQEFHANYLHWRHFA